MGFIGFRVQDEGVCKGRLHMGKLCSFVCFVLLRGAGGLKVRWYRSMGLVSRFGGSYPRSSSSCPRRRQGELKEERSYKPVSVSRGARIGAISANDPFVSDLLWFAISLVCDFRQDALCMSNSTASAKYPQL